MTRGLRLLAIPLLLLMFLVACGDDDDEAGGGGDGNGEEAASTTAPGEVGEDTGTVNLLSAVDEQEAQAVQEIFDELINADADYEVEIESAGNFEQDFQVRAESGTLDIAAAPQPGSIPKLAEDGRIVALEDLGFDIAELEEIFGEHLVALGEYNGKHYGLPTNINLKSMVWYPKDDFDAAGYEVPETWDDLIALSDQIIEDGSTPWCIGLESEGSTGWPATDWVEDIMLRTAGPEVYDQWVSHEIPFNDAPIVAALERFGEDVLFKDGYVLGGSDNVSNLAFGEAFLPMFDEEPGCWLHRQATFINAFFPEEAEAGVDFDWFPLPPIDQEGILYGGELTVVGSNRPEVKEFLDAFISQEVQCGMGEVAASSRVSPHTEVGPDCYANDLLADASEILLQSLEEGTGRFDASDLMPASVGQGSFWTAMVEYANGGSADNAQSVLDEVEDTWPE